MITLRALALCAVAVAAACAPSREEQARIWAADDAACTNMGFSYESQEYSDCRFRLEEMRQARATDNRRAGDAMMMQGLGMLYDSSRSRGGYPVRTYTYPSGRVVTCTETPYSTNCI